MKITDKTPIQELIEWCESFKDYPCRPTVDNMKEKAYQLLQKEKQGIFNAYITSAKAWSDLVLSDSDILEDAEKYYNDKFK